MSVTDRGDSIPSEVIADARSWRRHLHRHPELAFNEFDTSEFIAARLAAFGLKVHRGLGGTGVVGTLSRGSSRRTIAIRADMDALPIDEQTAVDYVSSKRGAMHACGHDGHVAIALGAARACAARNDLDGTIHFIFQPAEEGECGAKRMIEDGLFQLFPCDSIYSLHNQPWLPLGRCVVRDGVMLSACALFEITIEGRGCHGGRPHLGVDPILTSCQLVSSLQSIASRNVDPLQAAVVSVTQIRSGDNFNVVPERCLIKGTTRWLDDAVGDIIERRMRALVESTAEAFGCGVQIRYERKFHATVNDPAEAQFVRSIAETVPGLQVVDHPPTTGAEDFSEMLRAVPGCYLWLGGGKSDSDPGLHSPRYDFNDDVLPLGVALWVSLATTRLRAE